MPTAPAAIAARLKWGVAPPKTVLVTGASRGLGRALVLELAKRGHIVIGCLRSAEKVKSLESELMAFTPNASSSSAAPPLKHFVADLDVRSDSSVKELAKLVVESGRVPDIIGCTILCFKMGSRRFDEICCKGVASRPCSRCSQSWGDKH